MPGNACRRHLQHRRAPPARPGGVEIEIVGGAQQQVGARQEGIEALGRRQQGAAGADAAGDQWAAGDHRVGDVAGKAAEAVFGQPAATHVDLDPAGRDEGGIGKQAERVDGRRIAEQFGSIRQLRGRTAGEDRGCLRRFHHTSGIVDAGQARDQAGGALQENALFRAERHALEAGFPEIIGPEKGPERLTRIVHTAFEAQLLAARILGKFEIPGLGAVGVEHLVAVEIAPAGDPGEAPIVIHLVAGRQVEIIDIAGQARLVGPQHGGAERRPADFLEAVGAGGAAGGREAARGKGRARCPLAVIGAHQIDGEIRRRREAQRDAGAILALAIEIIDARAVRRLRTGTAGDILHHAIAQLDGAGDPQGDHVVAKVDVAIDAALIKIAIAHTHFARGAGTRLGGDHRNDADGRCGAEERRLRALHHFDAFKIIEIEIGAARPRHVDAVQIDGDGRCSLRGTAVGGDAADHETRVVGALFLHIEAGHIGRELVELGDADLAQGPPGVGGDGDRHVALLLLALLGGDDNLLAQRFGDLIIAGGLGCGGGQDNERGADEAGTGEQRETAHGRTPC